MSHTSSIKGYLKSNKALFDNNLAGIFVFPFFGYSSLFEVALLGLLELDLLDPDLELDELLLDLVLLVNESRLLLLRLLLTLTTSLSLTLSRAEDGPPGEWYPSPKPTPAPPLTRLCRSLKSSSLYSLLRDSSILIVFTREVSGLAPYEAWISSRRAGGGYSSLS
jgi:hypothetical protein